MRWVVLLLMSAVVALGTARGAIHWRVRTDRQGTSVMPRSKALEQAVRAFEDGRPVPSALSPGDANHPWGRLVRTRRDAEPMSQFAKQYRGTPPGARALLFWVKAAEGPEERTRRRAVFREHYPRSWILNAWAAESKP